MYGTIVHAARLLPPCAPRVVLWHPLACEQVVPFYRPGELEGDAWAEHATATYRSAFDAAQRHGLVSVAVPLLGGAHFAASRSRGPNTRFPIFEGAACTCPSPYRLGAGARGAEMPDASFALKAAAEAAVSMRAATIASFPAQLWTRIGGCLVAGTRGGWLSSHGTLWGADEHPSARAGGGDRGGDAPRRAAERDGSWI